ncbi:MAG: hypothetical protein IJ892_00720, partial [Prevotella sp.]|nr:hypothetical protein [Prevotella sp.]
MKTLLLIFALFLQAGNGRADNSKLFRELDQVISEKGNYVGQKEETIAALKQQLAAERDSDRMMKLTEDIFREYKVFKFDSAMVYANRGLALARQRRDASYVAQFSICRSEILAIGGLYTEALSNLEQVDTTALSRQQLFFYHQARFNIYLYWANYCNDREYAPQYMANASHFLAHAIRYLNPGDEFYNYFLGEYHVFVEPDTKKARHYYEMAFKGSSEQSRVHAMTSFALAGNYLASGDQDRYEEYLIKAALSDTKCCTMENMALQTLALRLFEKGNEHIKRAEQYINTSMEDAKFYNNRLRILEISRIMPQIMSSYQERVEQQNRGLRYSVLFISLLLIGLFITSYFIHRQNRQLSARRHELATLNAQLSALNSQLSQTNAQLSDANTLLSDTNTRRENLASIYIDLCAKYIDKLGRYQTLVKRKIKANQAQELLQTISSTRISEEDAATFLNRFDKAFLELYPSFVDDFNALLLEDGRIWLKTPNTLTTELRTF